MEFFFHPHQQLLVNDGLVQQIDVVVQIIAQFLDGINICADVGNIIRIFRPFDLT